MSGTTQKQMCEGITGMEGEPVCDGTPLYRVIWRDKASVLDPQTLYEAVWCEQCIRDAEWIGNEIVMKQLVAGLTIPSSTSALEILDGIAGWLQRADDWEDRERLWNVLSALRGPDSDNERLKADTTQWIRGVFFDSSAPALVDRFPSKERIQELRDFLIDYDPDLQRDDRNASAIINGTEYKQESSHFLNHIRWAARSTLQMLDAAGDKRLEKHDD